MENNTEYKWYMLGDGISIRVVDAPYIDPPILDWEGIEDKEGNLIPYSKEKAIELLKETSLSAFIGSI